MDEEGRGITRREFLGAAGAGALGMTMLGKLALAQDASTSAKEQHTPQIATRPFGKKGLVLPILGMGSSPLVPAWSRGYGSKPASVEDRAKLVRYAYDRGVRYFDTARSYYDAEQVIGQGLKGVAKNCVIASKVTVAKPDQVRPSVEKSLEVLGVDRIDIMQIHSSGAIEHGGFEPAMKIHAELVKLRDKGLFKYIGLTTHVAFETVQKTIATGGFDQALLTICCFNKGMDTMLSEQNRAWREKCLAQARDLGMGVVAMKVMGVSIFGRMSKTVVRDYDPARRAKLPAAAMRWVLNDKRVSLAVIGMGYREEVDANVATASSDLTLTDEDKKLLADYSKKAYESPRIKAMGVDDEKPDPAETAETWIERYDRDGDGMLSMSEAPPDRRSGFGTIDKDKDGLVSLDELTEAIKRRQGQ